MRCRRSSAAVLPNEAIRCIDIIKQHGIDIAMRNGAINDYDGKSGKVCISKVGNCLSRMIISKTSLSSQ